MGAFIVSFHAKTGDPSAVRDVLAGHAERAWLGPATNGWVPFYEEQADTQDGTRIEELCQRTSVATKSPVIAFLVHDSDFLCYTLFDRGKKRDEYNSCPDYFGDVDDLAEPGESSDDVLARVRGDVDALLPLCPAGTDRAALERLLHVRPGEYVFAEEHLQKLATVLGIDPERAATTYRDIGLEVPAEDLGLQFVGTGSQPEPGEDSWQRGAGPTPVASPPLSLFDPTALGAALGKGAEAGGKSDPSDVYARVQAHLKDMARHVKDPNQKLGLAVMSRNPAAAREAIAEGADPNASFGTPLMTAVATQSEEMVRFLLDAGAKPEVAPTVVGIAATTGNEAIVRVLLDRGADANAPNPAGWSPLHCAVQARSPAVVRLLLDSGADTKARATVGGTPLDMAEMMLRQIEAAAVNRSSAGFEEMMRGLRAVRDMLREAEG